MKNGRRTIVMAHVDLKAGRIEFLVKKTTHPSRQGTAS